MGLTKRPCRRLGQRQHHTKRKHKHQLPEKTYSLRKYGPASVSSKPLQGSGKAVTLFGKQRNSRSKNVLPTPLNGRKVLDREQSSEKAKSFRIRPAKKSRRILFTRQPWTADEDRAVAQLVEEHGTTKWSLIAELMREKYKIQGRTGKQCRERWHNHLDPSVNKAPLNEEEEKVIFEGYRKHGNKWAEIAKMVEGRTDNAIKNFFYSTLRRQLRKISKKIKGKLKSKKKRQQTEVTLEYLQKIMREYEVPYSELDNVNVKEMLEQMERREQVFEVGREIGHKRYELRENKKTKNFSRYLEDDYDSEEGGERNEEEEKKQDLQEENMKELATGKQDNPVTMNSTTQISANEAACLGDNYIDEIMPFSEEPENLSEATFKARRPPSLNMDLVSQPARPFSFPFATPMSARADFFPLTTSPLNMCTTPMEITGSIPSVRGGAYGTPRPAAISPMSFLSPLADTSVNPFFLP